MYPVILTYQRLEWLLFVHFSLAVDGRKKNEIFQNETHKSLEQNN